MIAAAQGEEGPSTARRDPRPILVGLVVLVAAGSAHAWGGPGAAAALLGAAVLSAAALPLVAAFARRVGATVLPGGRSVHAVPTPLLGGIAVVLPLLLVLLLQGGERAHALAFGCALLMVVGLFDDLRGLSPGRKLLLQAFAAAVLFAGGFRLPALLIAPLGAVGTGAAHFAGLLLWLVLVVNAVNLIDGMDGLAAGSSCISSLALLALGAGGLAAAALAGSLLGFLRHNLPLPRARIFLGDAGSMPVGLCLAALLLDSPRGLDLPVAFGILALPLGDLFLACARRGLRGKPLFAADRGHVHHLLLRAWQSPRRVLAALLLFAAAQASVALLRPDLGGLLCAISLWALLCAYLLVRSRDCVSRMVRRRRTFKRVHLLRRYADQSLALAERREEVAPILARIAEDLGLASLRVRDFDLRRPSPAGAEIVAESIPCAGGDVHVTLSRHGDDEIYDEERRTVLCDLVRRADAVLARIAAPAPCAPPAPPMSPRPAVHFIACGRPDLLKLAPVLSTCRERGSFRPLLVHTGCRDALAAQMDAHGETLPVEPDIDLDVDAERDALRAALAMERYDSLLEVARPVLAVVAGHGGDALACAIAARRRGLLVVHLGDEGATALQRALARAVAEFLDAGEEVLPALEKRALAGVGA